MIRERLVERLKTLLSIHTIGKYDILKVFQDYGLSKDVVVHLSEPFHAKS